MSNERDLKHEERAPTSDELRAMAYADGELPESERKAFEAQLAARSDLRLEVARIHRLDVLARQAAGPEPMDHEWRALRTDSMQRAALGLGWTLFGSGAAVLAALGLWELWSSEASLLMKSAVSAVTVGFALLLGAAVRARLLTRAYDAYTEIRR